jgi:hypothetical protein
MKRHIRILLTAVAIVFATFVFASAIGSTHSSVVDARSEHVHHQNAQPPQHFREHTGSLQAADHERETALADMYAHAQRHFDAYTPHLETFGGSTEWSAEWSLHWLDVDHDGTAVRLYHATHKQHPERRFTWMSHSGDPHPTAWEKVR